MNRRGFLTGLGALFAAPAIVRASNIMPIKSILDEAWAELSADMNATMYGDLVALTRKAFVPRLFVQIYSANPLLNQPLQWGAE